MEIPGLTAVGVRQGKGGCNTVLNIPPPPDLGGGSPTQESFLPIYTYTQTGVQLTYDPPPPLFGTSWEEGLGATDL